MFLRGAPMSTVSKFSKSPAESRRRDPQWLSVSSLPFGVQTPSALSKRSVWLGLIARPSRSFLCGDDRPHYRFEFPGTNDLASRNSEHRNCVRQTVLLGFDRSASPKISDGPARIHAHAQECQSDRSRRCVLAEKANRSRSFEPDSKTLLPLGLLALPCYQLQQNLN